MHIINPYLGRGTPVCGERLIGRKEVLDRLFTRLMNKTHCSIVGLPRIGKTSLAKELQRMIMAEDSTKQVCYITLDAASCPVHAYQRILMEMNDDIIVPSLTASHDEGYMIFLKRLRERRKSHTNTIVIFDELDGITRKCFKEASLFLSRIREVANDYERYGLTFLFISRRSLDTIQGAVDFSTLSGLCEVVYVKPLEYERVEELIMRSPKPVDEEAKRKIWAHTGGHPYLSEVLMCEAIEQEAGRVSEQTIECSILNQAHEFTGQYKQLQLILTPNTEFDYFCELIVGPRWRPIPPQTVNLLRQYGLIKKNVDDRGESVACLSDHLREYLSLLARNTPTWDLVGVVERQLRTLVADRMYKAYGNDWASTLSSRHKCFNQVYEDLLKKREKEQKLFGEAASFAILDYTYIGDLKDLMFVEWDKYKDILAGSKPDWDKKFQIIMKVRNPLAHNRQIPPDELYYAEKTCKQLLEILQGNHST